MSESRLYFIILKIYKNMIRFYIYKNIYLKQRINSLPSKLLEVFIKFVTIKNMYGGKYET